jgi:hypothetical protein
LWDYGAVSSGPYLKLSMVNIDKELEAAKAAKAVMDQLSTTPTKIALIRTLRAANTAAVLNVGKGGALNEARTNVGIALSNVLNRQPTLETIEKTKAAIDAWIKELKAAGA